MFLPVRHVVRLSSKNRNNPLLSTLPNDVINCNDRSNYRNIILMAIGRKAIDEARSKLCDCFFVFSLDFSCMFKKES